MTSRIRRVQVDRRKLELDCTNHGNECPSDASGTYSPSSSHFSSIFYDEVPRLHLPPLGGGGTLAASAISGWGGLLAGGGLLCGGRYVSVSVERLLVGDRLLVGGRLLAGSGLLGDVNVSS